MDYEEDRLESVNLQASRIIERVLIKVGRELHKALVDAERYDEVTAIKELIGEYSAVASFYGERTGRIPEDLGVDLNEAMLLKESDLKKNGKVTSNTWKEFADSAIRRIEENAANLKISN